MGVSLLQESLGLSGPASPAEIKARYRALAQRCGDAPPEDHERLRRASLLLAQELAYLGHDEAAIERVLSGEGCPGEVAASVASAAGGPVSRVVGDPLERPQSTPVDVAYTRLAERALATESLRTATASSYGFGFIARLAIAFLVVIAGLIAALDFFPRLVAPAKLAPAPPRPVPVELLPAPARDGRP